MSAYEIFFNKEQENLIIGIKYHLQTEKKYELKEIIFRFQICYMNCF